MRICGVFVILLCVGSSLAVHPETFDHSSEADFVKGKFEKTLVSSLGEIRLARGVEVVLPTEQAPEVVSAIVVGADKNLYVACGEEAKIYRLQDGRSELLAELPGAMVTSLIVDGAAMLAGTGDGQGAGIYKVDTEGNVEKLWSDPAVTYVWAIVRAPDDTLYAGTGPEGKVYTVDISTGQAERIYHAGKLAKNILSLALSEQGLLYAGSDKSGLVIEIDTSNKTSRILLDADEKEIASLVIAPGGGLYAATSDAAKLGATVRPNHVSAGKAASLQETQPAAPEEPSVLDEAPAPEEPAQESDSAEPEAPSPQTQPLGADMAEMPETIMKAIAEARAEEEEGPTPRPSRRKGGNAVYFIRPDGLVETPFRRPVTILAMLLADGKLTLATGNDGAIYTVGADGDEVTKLADTDADQVTCLQRSPEGEILFGTANKGSVGRISDSFVESGTFVSSSLDASQPARWGTIHLRVQDDRDADISVATRSGNVAKAEEETWSSWSEEQPVGEGFLSIVSSAGRFLQYRLTLRSNEAGSPVVQQVQVVYQVGNLAPTVKAVTVKPSEKAAKPQQSTGGPKAFRHIQIKAEDANKDKLSYTVEYRQRGIDVWVTLAKDLTKPKYVWDTRTVTDGIYELRVTASDSPANPPADALSAARISDPIVVDNTPPAVKDLAIHVTSGDVVVRGVALDAGSRIISVAYVVDSQEAQIVVAAQDGLYDSSEESFSFRREDMKAGTHRIAVKVTDLYKNVRYASVGVTVETQP